MANKKIFCNAPWFHIQINHDGSYGLCCMEKRDTYSNYSQTDFNIKTMSIREWFNTDRVKNFRKQILGDEYVKECDYCYRDEEFGNDSYRITQNWRSVIFTKQEFDKSFDQSPHKKIFISSAEDGYYNGYPVDLHVDLGNECNLSCKFCHPVYSSKIASKYKQWGILSKDLKIRHNWHDDDEVWNKFLHELLEFKNLRSVHFMGGEPTLNPRLEQFFDFFIQNKKTDFAVSFVTNGTKFSIDLVDKMKKFSRADIDISIESILDNNYYIRQGLNKELYLSNIKKYIECQDDKFFLCLKPVLSVLSIPTYPELIEFFYNNNIVSESNICHDPKHLRVSVLPYAIRQKYIPKFESLLEKLKNKNESFNPGMVQSRFVEKNVINLYNELNTAYNMLLEPEPENIAELQKELVYWLKKWDKDLKLDARKHYPEWTEFLEANGYDL